MDSALLSSSDVYLLEATEWPKGSQASSGVWRVRGYFYKGGKNGAFKSSAFYQRLDSVPIFRLVHFLKKVENAENLFTG